jgi:hypothetical protein
MRKLLEELKKIDPACYEEIARGLEQVDIEYEEDIIQGACQRAVAARGWGHESGMYGIGFGTEEGEFRWIQTGWEYRAFVLDPHSHPIASSRGDTPATAILSAYLSAIRSQP